MLFCLPLNAPAQILQLQSRPDSLHETNELTFGAEKLVTTYLFTGIASVEQEVLGGKFKLFDSYSGTSIKTIKSNFRDDELFQFLYEYPVSKNLFFTARQNWLYWNTKNIILNKYERINGLAGLKFRYYKNSSAEISAGIENIQQVGIKSFGSIISGKANLSDYNFNEFIVNYDLNGEYANLELNRVNANLDGRVSIIRFYDSSNSLGYNLKYKILNGDYYNPPSGNIAPELAFENRLEKRFGNDFNMNFSFTKYLITFFNASYNSGSVTREYKNIISDAAITKVRKLVNDNQFFLRGDLRFTLETFSQSLGMSWETGTEKNSFEKKTDLSSTEEQYLKSTEFYPDYEFGRTRLFAKTRWNISSNEIILFDYSVSLYQYDTPSNLNNDDKDEFSNLASFVYSKKFSDILKASLKGEILMNHLVYLKSASSSQNAWNRIIRLSPQINLETTGFSMEPQFEVLANYTDYYFVAPNQSPSNFTSLRQVSYKDSIFLNLGSQMSVQSRLIFRYSEKGILFWKEFAESPQNSNFEQFAKLLLFVNINSSILLGVGGRYYIIAQNKLNRKTGSSGLQDYNLRSYGPETYLRAQFPSGSEINFQGWYDFQLINNKEKLYVPNFLLQTSIKL